MCAIRKLIEMSIAVVFFSALSIGSYWFFEPSNYALMILKSSTFPSTPTIIRYRVVVNRIKLCPFRTEATFFDALGTKRLDAVLPRTTPETLGHVEFETARMLDTKAALGPGAYRARIGSMCNPLRRIFPQWGDWNNLEIEIKQPGFIR